MHTPHATAAITAARKPKQPGGKEKKECARVEARDREDEWEGSSLKEEAQGEKTRGREDGALKDLCGEEERKSMSSPDRVCVVHLLVRHLKEMTALVKTGDPLMWPWRNKQKPANISKQPRVFIALCLCLCSSYSPSPRCLIPLISTREKACVTLISLCPALSLHLH